MDRATDTSAASTFVSAGRESRVAVPTIDRMQVEDVSISYGAKEAVKQVSLPIRQGEVLGLIGPSGCGKTTLLRSLNRLTELTRTASMRGRITLDGADIAQFDATALRRRVTMVFQQPNPFPMSVFDNIAYVLREQARRKPRRAARCAPRWRTRWRGPGCWRRSATTSTIPHCGCPAASSSGCASPVRSPPGPRCFSSTSRARRWTR